MLHLDADVRNADWVKTRTWDLPTTLEELLVTIGGKSGIPRLLASPVAEAMPPALRAQVTATTMTLPALKAYRADLQRLLDGFLQVDEKLRHVRDADYWGAPVGTPLPLPKAPDMRVPRVIPPSRERTQTKPIATPPADAACKVITSLDDLTEANREKINNNPRSKTDPAHRQVFAKDNVVVDVSVDEAAAHIASVLDICESGHKAGNHKTGVRYAPDGTFEVVDRGDPWDSGQTWYQEVHDLCREWEEELGVSPALSASVIAATSPKQSWKSNLTVAHRILVEWKRDDFGGRDTKAAGAALYPNANGEMVQFCMTAPATQAIAILRSGDPDGTVTGPKRRSFVNNITDPDDAYDVTNDGWMSGMVWRMHSATGVRKKHCDQWLGHHWKEPRKKGQKGKGKDMPGMAGYVILAEAVRRVARDRHLLPQQVQAIYWLAVGGGTDEAMVPEVEGAGTKARKPVSDWPYTDPADDPTGGDLTDPDYWDAILLRMEQESGVRNQFHSAHWLETGRYEWPGENPKAVAIFHGDTIKALLAGFQAVEQKLRHVRDAEFWGAPVGTPLPLPRTTVPGVPDVPTAERRVAGLDEVHAEYMRVATERVAENAPALDRDDELAPRLKQYVAESISEAMADVPADDMFKATYDERRYTGTEHMGHDAYMEWDRYRSSADVFLHPSQGDPEHTRIAWFEGRLWEYDDRTPPIAVRDPRGPVYANGPVGSPEAEKAKRMFAVSELVHLWAVTSNDSNIPALAMQEVARDVFGLDDAEHWKVDPEEATKVAQTKDTYRSIYERYLRAEYDSTQTLLKGMGITHVRLHRGYTTNGRHSGRVDPPRNNTTVSTRPMSSWSLNDRTARNFSLGNGSEVVVTAEFPVERILSTPLTGSGCWGESEMVVLGGVDETEPFDLTEGEVRVQVKADVQPLSLDDGDLNADWIRTLRWDLPTDPVYYSVEYLRYLLSLPVGRAMPEQLRATLEQGGTP